MLFFLMILLIICPFFSATPLLGFMFILIIAFDLQVSISYEDSRPVEGKEIGRKLMDKLYQTYSAELANKKFAYDGEKCLYSIGPLPQNKLEFTVVLEGSYAKRYAHVSFRVPTKYLYFFHV